MKTNASALNFISHHWLHLTLIAIVLTRIPLLSHGYGSDPDAWRVAFAGQALWTTGNYQMSRPPGYPLYEIISAPLVALGGSPLSNAATVVVTLLLVVVTHRWARNNARHPRLLTFLVAFMPLIWLNSATTMDYLWSLLFIVLAFYDVQKNTIVRAGIWMGIAAGFRLTNIVAVIPLCVMIWLMHRSKKPVTTFLIATCATTVLAFSPILLQLGPQGWLNEIRAQASAMHLCYSDRVLYFGYRGLYSIGLLGTLAAVGIVVSNWKLVQQLLQERDVTATGYSVAIVTFLGLFFWLPLDRSYLLPAIFILLLLLDKVSGEKQFLAFALCTFSFAFINIDLVQHEETHRAKLLPHLAPGIVIEEIQKRELQLARRNAIANTEISGKVIIMTGNEHQFWFENPGVERDTSETWKSFYSPVVRKKTDHNILFTAALNQAELNIVRAAGYAVYYVESMKNYLESFIGYTMSAERIETLPF